MSLPNSLSNDARNRLAAALDIGDWLAAEAIFQAWTQQSPGDAEAWLQLGLVKLQRGKLTDAEAAFRQSLGLQPAVAGVWHNLSVVLRELGRYDEAESAARQALALDGASPAIWLNLANTLYCLRRWDDAAVAYRESLALDPACAAAWTNLAATEQLRGQVPAALTACERSLELSPDDPLAALNYAQLLKQTGEPHQAAQLLEALVARQPQFAAAWVALAAAHSAAGNLPRAAAACLTATQLAPDDALAQQNLVLLMRSSSSLPLLEDAVQQALAANPLDSNAWSLLGLIRLYQARHDESIAAQRRSLEIEPHAGRHSKLLFTLQCAAGVTPQSLLAEHRHWAALHASPALPRPAPPGCTGQRLRIGFVAGDFCLHPIGFMALPLIEHLDKSQCFVACYEDRPSADAYNARFRAAADLWRSTGQLTNVALAQQIRADEIDVLVDLAGHLGGRLPAFALRPSPLAVTWFGYVGTTGVAQIDCLLADRFHVPPGEERHYVERVLQPHGYACYGPPPDAPDVAPLPCLAADHVTFGCFNSPVKFSAPLFDWWAAILRRIPRSQLLLKFNGLNQLSTQAEFRRRFAQRGIEPDRIQLEGFSPHCELLEAYSRIDLALDTQPYSGGLTTCEALWMGVPVITCPGPTFASRHSLSYLTNADLPEFIAANPAAYIDLAAHWATRPCDLAALRATLRDQLRHSPVCDAATFARDWLSLIRDEYAKCDADT